MDTSLAPTPTARPRISARVRHGVRSVAKVAVTPLAPTDVLDLIDPVRSRSHLRARIVAIRPETSDAATVVLRPGPAWQPHTPGQYLRVGVDVDGVRHWRSYSLTSTPDSADGHISITVKAIPDGTVSSHLVRRARPGDIVQLEQAAGEFTLPVAAPAKALFVVAGSGITPVMSMLRSRADDLADAVVVHCATTEADALFRDELRSLATATGFDLVERFSERDGRLDAEQLAELVPDLAERETWACGPAGLLDQLQAHWDLAGRGEHLHIERFRPVVVEPGEGGTVSFATSDRTVEVDGATSLLDAGEAAGVLMPSGCRMGICFGCVAPLRRGAVRDMRTGEITVATDGDISIQTCISTAAAGCEVEL